MSKEVKIAVMVLATIALTSWGYMFLKGKDIFQKSLVVETIYTDVDELAVSSPILVNGVKVGNVTEIILDPNDIKHVKVKFTIEGVSHIPKNAVAELKSKGIMGGKLIEITFPKSCTGNGDCLQDGDVVIGKPVGLVSSMLNTDVTTYVDELKGKISNFTDPNSKDAVDISVIMHDLKNTIKNLNAITEQASKIISSSTYNVNNISKNLKSFSDNLEANNSKITSIVSNLESVTNDFKKVNIGETINSAKTAIATTENAVGEIKQTVESANGAIKEINGVVQKIERGEGSLGLLVNDKKLYKDLSNTSNQINLLLQDIRLNPKRYINVSVFGKKQKNYVKPEDDPANK